MWEPIGQIIELNLLNEADIHINALKIRTSTNFDVLPDISNLEFVNQEENNAMFDLGLLQEELSKTKDSKEKTKIQAEINETEKNLKEHADKVTEEDKNKITADIEELKKVKDSDDMEVIKSKTEALVQSSMKLGEAIYKQDPQAGEGFPAIDTLKACFVLPS